MVGSGDTLSVGPSPTPVLSVSFAATSGESDAPSSRSSTPHDEQITLSRCDYPGSTSMMRVSLMLNPADGDDEPEPDENSGDVPTKPKATTADGVVAKVPKKRGRKPILPKMTNSERGKYYRAKRLAYSSTLHQDVDALRSTIARLVALRSISNELAVCPRNMTSGSLVKLVREYFTQFRYGVQLPPARRNMELLDVETSTASQEIFMQATMDPELCFGEFKGIGVVMDQWERYSKYHAFLQFELIDVRVRENEDGHIVETSGRLRTRYSRRTIENVFPHVVGNEPLIQRLIGKEVVYPCRNQFYFTPEGRVQRYDVEADFPEALQQAIGSLDDVAVLLGQALIRQQHMMGELEGDELAVIEEIERRVHSTDVEGTSRYGGSSISRGDPSPPRTMDVEFLLSDEPESDVNDDMDLSDERSRR